MKLRDKVIISILVGLVVMALYSAPMWWGVLFTPLCEQLTTAQATADAGGWFRLEIDGVVFRLKSLDMLFSLFHG